MRGDFFSQVNWLYRFKMKQSRTKRAPRFTITHFWLLVERLYIFSVLVIYLPSYTFS